MSDDLIRRVDVEKFLCDAYDDDIIDEGELAGLISESHKLPAVLHEMSAREYGATINRMCGIYYVDCEKCPLETENNGKGKPCSILQKENLEVSIAIIEKWAKEHPEERSEK